MSDQTDSSGVGGRNREKSIMSQVAEAETGGPKHPAATPSNPTNTRPAPAPASSFAPSDDKGSRVYGSPIEGAEASK
jgi:hypothetical protein